MRQLLTVTSLVFALAVPAAARAQNREHQQMFADLRMLQEQVQQLRLAVNTLAESVKTVNTKQDEQATATSRAFAGQKLLIDQLTDSIRILREKGDDTNVRLSTLSHELETMRQSMQSLQASIVQAIATLNAQPAGAGATPADPNAPAAPPVSAPPAVGQSPQTLYDAAWSEYMSSHYDLAITGFQAYLRSYPTSPDAYKAQFNIGEAYKYANRLREAIQAYTAVITNYKGNPWEDQAYYARGLAYEQTQQKDLARADMQYIIKTFPEGNYVPLAKNALERIK